MMDMEGILKVILFFIGFSSLIFLTYVTTRYVGGKQSKAMKGKNISILETVALGMDKRIHLIKAGNQYVLVASTSKTIEFLTTVDLDENVMNQETVQKDNGNVLNFKSLLEKYMVLDKTKKENKVKIMDNDNLQETYKERDFKHNLHRLKTMIQKNEYKVKTNEDERTNEK